jgi:hypothetical protein
VAPTGAARPVSRTNMEEQPPPKWPPWVVAILIVLGVAALALIVLAIWLVGIAEWGGD